MPHCKPRDIYQLIYVALIYNMRIQREKDNFAYVVQWPGAEEPKERRSHKKTGTRANNIKYRVIIELKKRGKDTISHMLRSGLV